MQEKGLLLAAEEAQYRAPIFYLSRFCFLSFQSLYQSYKIPVSIDLISKIFKCITCVNPDSVESIKVGITIVMSPKS